MAQTIIENPIINSPYEEPARHFRFSEEVPLPGLEKWRWEDYD